MSSRFLDRVEWTPEVEIDPGGAHPASPVALTHLESPTVFGVGDETVLRGVLKYDTPTARARLADDLEPLDVSHFFEPDGDATVVTITHPRAPAIPRAWPLNLGLFILTALSTLLAGAGMAGETLASLAGDPWRLAAGAPFAGSLIAILAAHEFGHYFAARHYGLHVTLPYFLPLPLSPIGTLGAVIRMKTPIYTRRMLLDVGAAGPLAGMLVAIPVAIYGIRTSETISAADAEGLFQLGEPLLFRWMIDLFATAPGASEELLVNPVAFAGWIGLFLTAINMLPIGQLDGGHVLYALIGRGQHRIGQLFFVAMLVMGLWWQGWFVWAALVLFVIRIKHPPILDAGTKLDRPRRAIGWLTIAILVLCFTPVPFSLG